MWTPHSNLLARVQAVLVDFFWDRLHWLLQAVLFLPKEEGGQGLVHLASRCGVEVAEDRRPTAGSLEELFLGTGASPAGRIQPWSDCLQL